MLPLVPTHIPYSDHFLQQQLDPRFAWQNRRHEICSVANPRQRIAYILDYTGVDTKLRVDILANREHFSLLKEKNVAVCSQYNFGEMIELANKCEFEIDLLIVVPGSGQRARRDKIVAGVFTAINGAADGRCKIRWFGGRVAFLEPWSFTTHVHLEGLKERDTTDIEDLKAWPRDGLAALAAATRKMLVLPRKEANELHFHHKWGTLVAVADTAACGPVHTFLKSLGPQLPNPIAALD